MKTFASQDRDNIIEIHDLTQWVRKLRQLSDNHLGIKDLHLSERKGKVSYFRLVY